MNRHFEVLSIGAGPGGCTADECPATLDLTVTTSSFRVNANACHREPKETP